MKTRFYVILTALVCLLAFSSVVLAAETIRIGALYPLSGPHSAFGVESFRGAELARLARNAAGGINGKQIEFVIGDAIDDKIAAQEAQRLITQEGVQVLIGTYSSTLAYTATETAQRLGAVYFELGAVADEITQRGYNNVFRFAPRSSSFGWTAAEAANVVSSILGKDPADVRVVIVHEDTIWGESMANFAQSETLARGLNLVARESYSANALDLTPLVLKLRQLRPDVVIAASYLTDAILLFRNAREMNLGFQAWIGMGAGYAIPEFYEAIGRDVNGVFAVEFPGPDINPDFAQGLEELKEAYRAQYGRDITSAYPQVNYTGAQAMFDIMERAGSLDPDALRQAAHETDIPAGSTVTSWGVKFAPPGDPDMGTNLRSNLVLLQWQDGQLVTVWPYEAAAAEIINVPMPQWGRR